MHGIGRASAAISVVNALAGGIGCAFGVRLYAAAALELAPADRTELSVEPPESDTPLVRAAFLHALRRAANAGTFSARLTVDSEVPVGKGLKSSSAVASAVVRSVGDAVHAPLAAEEVARVAAAAGRDSGVSATGAYDDALAGLVPGFVVTDNRDDRLLLRARVEPDWTAVVHIPAGTHPRSPDVMERFRAEESGGASAAESALAQRWGEAMDRNTRLVERVMGYDYAELRSRLAAAGALASGVSGMGPSLAALVPAHRVAEVLATMPSPRVVLPVASEAHP